MNFKYIVSQQTNPYYNLALEQCLFECIDADSAILYLWQNDNTIVIGKNQDIYTECKVEEFLNQNGLIARRKSGGGAVYHDLGNLNFSIISKNALRQDIQYQNLIVKMVQRLGIIAKYNGKNDITIGNKKFSGNAVYNNGIIMCQHGTILINSDIKKMTYYLTPEKEKLNRHHVKSVSSRVVNLKEVDSDITVQRVMRSFIQTTDATLLCKNISNTKIEMAMKFYLSKDWIYGGKI